MVGGHDPAPILGAVGIPGDEVGLNIYTSAHRLQQGRATARAADLHRLGHLGDVRPLAKGRLGVTSDLVQRPPGFGRDYLRRGAGADACLNFSRTERLQGGLLVACVDYRNLPRGEVKGGHLGLGSR